MQRLSLGPHLVAETVFSRLLVGVTLVLPALGSMPARAQKPEDPQVVQNSTGATEVGILAGAEYRIDVPHGWNGSLIVYFHGYAEHGTTFHITQRLHPDLEALTERHYAVAQSAYSEGGWALQQAYPETEALRRYFAKTYGNPKETYAVGGSMGGALVMITLELNPKPYLGGLDLCGAVGPTFVSFDRRFAMRAAFDVYFPGVMGPLVPVPADFDDTPAVRDRITAALKANPANATLLRSLMGLHTDTNVARDIAYFTFVLGDMQRRAGGNPFDNRNWIYSGADPLSSGADSNLNETVHRYAAEKKARDYLVHHYTPTGRLGRPMLAVHTIYDPYIPPSLLALYSEMVESAGFGDRLVQQFVPHDGHCAITPEEIGRAFDELVSWTHGGARPLPGLLREHPSETRQAEQRTSP